jgi:hypothetical protein
LPWATFALLAVHVAEEVPAFPAWATRHFGTTTPAFYVLSHIPLLAAVFYIARNAAAGAGTQWLWLAAAIQAGLAANGLFHLATTVVFGEYSPGVVTGAGLCVPFAVYFLSRVRGHGALRGAQVVTACVAGVVVAILLTASLWLHMDFV